MIKRHTFGTHSSRRWWEVFWCSGQVQACLIMAHTIAKQARSDWCFVGGDKLPLALFWQVSPTRTFYLNGNLPGASIPRPNSRSVHFLGQRGSRGRVTERPRSRASRLMTLTLRQPPQFEALFWRFFGRITLSAVVTKTGACRIVDGG